VSQRKQRLKKNLNKEILILAVANRTKISLKQASGYSKSTKVIHKKNAADEIVNTDGRKFFVSEGSDSGLSGVSDGGFQRGIRNVSFSAIVWAHYIHTQSSINSSAHLIYRS
jgi:hypothetical protein